MIIFIWFFCILVLILPLHFLIWWRWCFRWRKTSGSAAYGSWTVLLWLACNSRTISNVFAKKTKYFSLLILKWLFNVLIWQIANRWFQSQRGSFFSKQVKHINFHVSTENHCTRKQSGTFTGSLLVVKYFRKLQRV